MDNPYSINVQKPDKKESDEDEEMPDDILINKGDAIDKALLFFLKDLLVKRSLKRKISHHLLFSRIHLWKICVFNILPLLMKTDQHQSGGEKLQSTKIRKTFRWPWVKKYVDDNETERLQDYIVKSVVKKSAIKVFIIQAIDRKLSFEDIAIAKGLEIEELLTEIESIVVSWTKTGYQLLYWWKILNPYHQDEILDYFAEAETDCCDECLRELGEDEYTIEEIRIMRDQVYVRCWKLIIDFFS